MPIVYFEDLEVGSVHLGRDCLCDMQEMLEFSRRNDPWPFHVDEAAAARSPFGGIVASGGYIVTLWYRSLVEIYNTPRRNRPYGLETFPFKGLERARKHHFGDAARSSVREMHIVDEVPG